MSDMAARLRLELADKIASEGWHDAVASVPRERFLGGAVFLPDPARGDLWAPVRPTDKSEEDWLNLAYSNETWVTQVAGTLAEDATGMVQGEPRSSSTAPGLVVRMLKAAQISEGDKVLEIGTGTGYSTSLMCRRLGSSAVTSISMTLGSPLGPAPPSLMSATSLTSWWETGCTATPTTPNTIGSSEHARSVRSHRCGRSRFALEEPSRFPYPAGWARRRSLT